MVYANPFFVQVGPKNSNFRGFTNFFQNYSIEHNLLILIESPIIFHWKSAKNSKVAVVLETKSGPDLVQCCEKIKKLSLSVGFFHILHEEYI